MNRDIKQMLIKEKRFNLFVINHVNTHVRLEMENILKKENSFDIQHPVKSDAYYIHHKYNDNFDICLYKVT